MNLIRTSLFATVLALCGLAACAVDAQEPEATPISAPEVQRISGFAELAETRDRLAAQGYDLQLDEGLVYRRGTEYAAVFPIEAEAGGTCEYTSLTYQESDGRTSVFLERDEAVTVPPAEGFQAGAVTCGGWTNWITLDSWCEGVFPSCLLEGFNGTKRREWRGRSCCSGSTCWIETEYQTTLANCGC